MATAPGTLPECSVCIDSFSPEPVTTPCGHSFCRACLARSLRERRECPNCRAPVALGVELPVNFALRDAMAAAAELQERLEAALGGGGRAPAAGAGAVAAAEEDANAIAHDWGTSAATTATAVVEAGAGGGGNDEAPPARYLGRVVVLKPAQAHGFIGVSEAAEPELWHRLAAHPSAAFGARRGPWMTVSVQARDVDGGDLGSLAEGDDVTFALHYSFRHRRFLAVSVTPIL
jgi:hypothetical protein